MREGYQDLVRAAQLEDLLAQLADLLTLLARENVARLCLRSRTTTVSTAPPSNFWKIHALNCRFSYSWRDTLYHRHAEFII
jgi:hypothetical protein